MSDGFDRGGFNGEIILTAFLVISSTTLVVFVSRDGVLFLSLSVVSRWVSPSVDALSDMEFSVFSSLLFSLLLSCESLPVYGRLDRFCPFCLLRVAMISLW